MVVAYVMDDSLVVAGVVVVAKDVIGICVNVSGVVDAFAPVVDAFNLSNPNRTPMVMIPAVASTESIKETITDTLPHGALFCGCGEPRGVTCNERSY